MAFKIKNPLKQSFLLTPRVSLGNLTGTTTPKKSSKSTCTGKYKKWVPAKKGKDGKTIPGYCANLG